MFVHTGFFIRARESEASYARLVGLISCQMAEGVWACSLSEPHQLWLCPPHRLRPLCISSSSDSGDLNIRIVIIWKESPSSTIDGLSKNRTRWTLRTTCSESCLVCFLYVRTWKDWGLCIDQCQPSSQGLWAEIIRFCMLYTVHPVVVGDDNPALQNFDYRSRKSSIHVGKGLWTTLCGRKQMSLMYSAGAAMTCGVVLLICLWALTRSSLVTFPFTKRLPNLQSSHSSYCFWKAV